MRLHMLGLPHTRTVSEMSHCAFTGKVRRWGPMMAPLGYECLHYGVGAPDTVGWAGHIQVMEPEEQNRLAGTDIMNTGRNFVGNIADVGHDLYREFNKRLRALLHTHVRPKDTICLPFGHGHSDAVQGLLGQCIETGIGYPTAVCGYRIYESSAWMHWHVGRGGRSPWNSEWVVPNYFDPEEWPERPTPPSAGRYVLYLGRLTPIKGLWEIRAMALAMPDVDFVLCGQGEIPELFEGVPNLIYHEPVHGMDRARLMHDALAVVMPTLYVEPFGGVSVEAMLTGTPALTSNHSAFMETIPEQFRCNLLVDWITAIRSIQNGTADLYSHMLRTEALRKYSLASCAERYDHIFQQLPAMRAKGWYAGT